MKQEASPRERGSQDHRTPPVQATVHEEPPTGAATCTPPSKRWLDRRFLGVGVGAGLLSGVCCVGSALAVGAGLAGLSFFSTWMDRHQPYFIAAGVAAMALWLARTARRYRPLRRSYQAAARAIGGQAAVMAVVYAITLAVAMGASAAFGA